MCMAEHFLQKRHEISHILSFSPRADAQFLRSSLTLAFPLNHNQRGFLSRQCSVGITSLGQESAASS